MSATINSNTGFDGPSTPLAPIQANVHAHADAVARGQTPPAPPSHAEQHRPQLRSEQLHARSTPQSHVVALPLHRLKLQTAAAGDTSNASNHMGGPAEPTGTPKSGERPSQLGILYVDRRQRPTDHRANPHAPMGVGVDHHHSDHAHGLHDALYSGGETGLGGVHLDDPTDEAGGGGGAEEEVGMPPGPLDDHMCTQLGQMLRSVLEVLVERTESTYLLTAVSSAKERIAEEVGQGQE